MTDEVLNKSINTLALKLLVDEKTAQNCVRTEIKYKYYTLKKHLFMNEAAIKEGEDKATRLLCKFEHPQTTNQLIFFSDEKNVCWIQKVNKRNEIITGYALIFMMYQFKCQQSSQIL